MNILDVGAAPWSFLQVIAKIIWPEWKAVGIDIQKIDPNFGFPNIHLLEESVFEFEKIKKYLESIWFWKGNSQKREIRGSKNFSKGVYSWVNDQEKYETDDEVRSFSEFPQFDAITSDIAPSTTGMTGVDQYKSVELNLAILDVAEVFLKKWWTLILKVFVWEDILDLIHPIKEKYKKLSRFKPKACRDRSFEEYFICIGKI